MQEEKEKLTKTTGLLMVITALFFDGFQGLRTDSYFRTNFFQFNYYFCGAHLLSLV